jgi:hypothetical protein
MNGVALRERKFRGGHPYANGGPMRVLPSPGPSIFARRLPGRAERYRANLPILLCEMRKDVRANRDYLRTRGGEAAMPEMWEQEGLSCAGSRLCGDIKEELGAHRMWPSLSDVQDNAVKDRFTWLF